jgi:hypothetical protein
MPIVKNADKFMDRQGASILVVTMVGIGLLMLFPMIPSGAWQVAAGIAWFLLMAAGWAVLGVRGYRKFKCPDCGGPVSDPLDTDGKPGTPILRHCPQCDVLWKVGTESSA